MEEEDDNQMNGTVVFCFYTFNVSFRLILINFGLVQHFDFMVTLKCYKKINKKYNIKLPACF